MVRRQRRDAGKRSGCRPADRARISENLRLAEQLGAETVTLTGERAQPRRSCASRASGTSPRSSPASRRVRAGATGSRTGFVDELILGSSEIDIYVTVGTSRRASSRRQHEPRPRREEPRRLPREPASWSRCRNRRGLLLFGRDHLADVVMTYLLGIVVIVDALRLPRVARDRNLSVLAFDFFFIPPYLTFAVATCGTSSRSASCCSSPWSSPASRSGCTTKRRSRVAASAERAMLYAMSRELARSQGRVRSIAAACASPRGGVREPCRRLRLRADRRDDGRVRADGFAAPLPKEVASCTGFSSNRARPGSERAHSRASKGSTFRCSARAVRARSSASSVSTRRMRLASKTPSSGGLRRFRDPARDGLERARLAEEPSAPGSRSRPSNFGARYSARCRTICARRSR